MFYKPNFCCSCGEKIQRAEWKFLTSRRFCDVCEIELKGHEWAVRGVVAAGLLIGLLGFGTYLKQPEPAQVMPLTAVREITPHQKIGVGAIRPAGIKTDELEIRPEQTGPGAAADRESVNKQELRLSQSYPAAPVYYCGAMTKKGRPCSRRVKSKVRCWQHTGQPPALASQSEPDVY